LLCVQLLGLHSQIPHAVADPGFAQKWDRGERARIASLNGGLEPAHSWIRHCPHGSATGPYWGLPQTPVLSPKANFWLYIRPCLTKFKPPFNGKYIVGSTADAAVTTKADNNIIYTQNMYDSSRLN